MTAQQTFWRRRSLPAAGIGFALALVVASDRPTLALVNESPSLPRGLYLLSGADVGRGSIVAIAQPEAVRPYLERLGMPTDVLLIKRVAAVSGDRVCSDGRTVSTPGRRVQLVARDGEGINLPAWNQCRTLADDELFLLGDTPGSFDSRYFGPVLRGEIKGVYREVLTW
jgi:conjugative transfer signal peptidase TraF